MTPDFVQIHNHSQYSKFDGFASVKDLVTTAKKFGMSACGLTDHGTFAGAIDFLQECRKQDIRPILGMEGYLAYDHKAQSKKDQPAGRKANRHINLIAKNHTGFQNICTLSQIASLDGFYYDPRTDLELLAEYSEGIIATSACLSNVVNYCLSRDQYEMAKKAVSYFQDIYGEDYYLEAMFHGLPAEHRILPDIQKLSKETGVKIIVTNDVHYINKADSEFQEIMVCISSMKTIKDPKKYDFPYKEFYFKSKEEMAAIFGSIIPSAMRNTLEIAEKCDYSDIILGGKMLLPKFKLPEGQSDPYECLKDSAWRGLNRLKLDDSPKHVERLKLELGDLKLIWDTKRFDFPTYFLIVEDVMNFARKKKILAGVRGSGYGSLLLKCIRIVESVIDPLEQDLMWERFLGFDDKYFLSEDDFGIRAA